MTAFGVVWAMRTGAPAWLLVGLPFVGLFFWMYRVAPRGYRLAPDGVHVERRARPVIIPYRGIRAVDRTPRTVSGVTMFGCKGPFGRFGSFWNLRLGFYRLYLSNTLAVVWLTTDGGFVGLSPDRADEFVERLRARLALL
ncbi:MAG: hypothetical protein HY216_12775 [Candidatus Rokubacteria bacterium]|nr:hypothetical protein [Candidatus Rokubacteria bacterium]